MRINSFKSHLGISAMPLFLAAVCMPTASWASVNETTSIEAIQQKSKTVKVLVKDASGMEIIGANVLVKGTTNGSITDMEGVANISNVPDNAILVVSYIGYKNAEVNVGKNGSVTVTLQEDSETLEEVVVTGYSTQAKKDITGSVAVVSRDALTEQPVATFAEALQGKASGVYITNGGGPAGQTTIRVRGVGSVNGSDPLVIVDGVQGVSIDSVNPNDIESMQVLKDAAATAIYGARAANGVIIVTTKQGNKEAKVRVNYSGYISASKMANSGFHMLGARDLVNALATANKNKQRFYGAIDDGNNGEMPYLINPTLNIKNAAATAGIAYTSDMETSTAARKSLLDYYTNNYQANGANSYALSSYYYIKDVLGGSEDEANQGTNWWDYATQTGISHNHELSLQGGGEKGMYAVSLGYTSREGAVKGSSFERYNLRMNTTYNPTKHFTFGVNSNTALIEYQGERGSMTDQSVFGQTYTMCSIVPAYNLGGTFAGSQGGWGRDTSPLASVENAKGDWTRNFRTNTAVFAEIKDPWIKGLSFRSQFAVSLTGTWTRTFNECQKEWNKENTAANNLNETANWTFNWQWTNTATYKKSFKGGHDVTVMVGIEALKNGLGHSISGTRSEYAFPNDQNTWTINGGSEATSKLTGDRYGINTMFGMFARADYSFNGKYLVAATIRRDASSRFGADNRWGTFPSISLGWRISDEAFMAKAHETWLDDLKLRAGYGTTGNSNIGNYNFASPYGIGYNSSSSYLFNGSTNTVGYTTTGLGNVQTKWETVKMLNFGVDVTALNNRLTFNGDFYIKTTSDMLVPASWTALSGYLDKPNVNIGTMKNTGVDLTIGWRDKIGEVGYNISATASFYKNEVTKLSGTMINGDNRIGADASITMEGQPIGMFNGYVVDGLYKSEADVLNYKNDQGKQVYPFGSSAETIDQIKSSYVGQFIYKDVNGDGVINDNDKTIIGNPHPDLTGGINIGLNWKNWDLGTYLYYSIGNDIMKAYQVHTLWGMLAPNYSEDRLNRAWHPDTNPNGDLPLFTGGVDGQYSNMNSMYIEDGSYLRMQTLTLGYTLPKSITKKLTLSKIRVYAQLGNVFTLTKYSGLDPEVTSFGNDRRTGVDFGNYGVPRQYLFGVNVDF